MLSQHTKDDRLKQAIAAGIDPYIGKREMARLRNCSERTLTRWVKEKRLPAPERIGVRKVGWRASLANLPFSELERIAKEQAGEAEGRPPKSPTPRGKPTAPPRVPPPLRRTPS